MGYATHCHGKHAAHVGRSRIL